ncbi:MAG: YceI family protein [Chitinophagales bacterium]|nr:YceI family protein [Chitinophagales bacterium]MDW8417986.1 YceI family protein [Chitinophagales bacterium]
MHRVLKYWAATLCIAALAAAKHTESFVVDTAASSLHWIGKKVTGQHDGYVKIKSGVLIMNHGTPVGGRFEIDMTTITCADIKDEKKNSDLVEHLKDDDFFSVKKFPTASLALTSISRIPESKPGEPNYQVSGNLTIKGITQPVQFPALFEIAPRQVKAAAKISIDRTKWNITYKSGTVFPSLADKAIYDNVEFEVFITANAPH